MVDALRHFVCWLRYGHVWVKEDYYAGGEQGWRHKYFCVMCRHTVKPKHGVPNRG